MSTLAHDPARTMFKRIFISALSTVMLLTGLAFTTASPAQAGEVVTPARAVSPITIYSPQGDTFEDGEVVYVTGYNASDGVEDLAITCGGSFDHEESVYDQGAFSINIGAYQGPETCQISDYYGNLLATFYV